MRGSAQECTGVHGSAWECPRSSTIMPCAANHGCSLATDSAAHACNRCGEGVHGMCARSVPGSYDKGTDDWVLFCSTRCSGSSAPTFGTTSATPGGLSAASTRALGSVTSALASKAKPKSRSSLIRAKSGFKPEHARKYGLEVQQRASKTGAVLSVVCRFCHVYGRSRVSSSKAGKRAVSRSKKSFVFPFRSDQFVSHLESQHPDHWAEYRSLADKAKDKYLEVSVPFRDTIRMHFGGPLRQYAFRIRPSIVEKIVCALYIAEEGHGTDMEDEDAEIPSASGACGLVFDPDVKLWTRTINRTEAFDLAISFLAVGVSFRQARRLAEGAKESLGVGALGSMSEQFIQDCARLAVCVNLEQIAKLLCHRACWAFSIAFDGATMQSKSFLDVRVRVYVNGDIENLHLLAIPIKGSHTGRAMFELVKLTLDGLAPDSWRDKLIGVSTDGAANMTGHVSGATSLIKNETPGDLYRVWCGAHQLDLVIQRVVSKVYEESFYRDLTGLIGWLRRQQSFVSKVGSKCPKVATTRWLSLGRVLKWLLSNRVAVEGHLQSADAACAPPSGWWIIMTALCKFMEPVDVCFKAVQGADTLLAQQAAMLSRLVKELRDMAGLKSASDLQADSEANAVGDQILYQRENVCATLGSIKDFTRGLSSSCMNRFDLLPSERQIAVMEAIGALFLDAVVEISSLRAERDEQNKGPGNALPSVTPKELLQLTPLAFNEIVGKQKRRLMRTHSEQQCEDLEQEFQRMKADVSRDKNASAAIDATSARDSFADSWKPVNGRYKAVQSFAGGLATVFPGTSTVESDFSVMSWEFDDYRQSLTEFSLEGVMQAKQYKRLSKLTYDIDE